MSNSFLDAITTYASLNTKQLGDHYDSKIGINQTGERLEYFVKDLIADSFDEDTKEGKNRAHNKHLSWTGTQNHPPDAIISGGEAIEIKKTSGKHPRQSLNSSPPRQTLHHTTSRINDDCRRCEDDIGGWTEKDLIYMIGSKVTKNSLGFMWAVYGDCWCDKNDFYLNISKEITEQIEEMGKNNDKISPGTDTNELGNLTEADVHGRTKLRIRGMWALEHPGKEFKSHVPNYNQKIDTGQPLFVVMRKTRYNDFSEHDRQQLAAHENVTTYDIQIPDPEHANNMLDAVLIEAH